MLHLALATIALAPVIARCLIARLYDLEGQFALDDIRDLERAFQQIEAEHHSV
jgi:hypothetical protein